LNQMPLAFTDAALARLAIAAGRIPHRRRGVFLRDFARYIEDGVDPRQVQKKRVEIPSAKPRGGSAAGRLPHGGGRNGQHISTAHQHRRGEE
jgi:hypothetical protein